MTPLVAVTLFVSAALLFVVQPMMARAVLPLLGGAPSTWNVCVVFFQVALLVGYGYAHLHERWLSSRASRLVHLAVLGAALVGFLPFAQPDASTLEQVSDAQTGLPQMLWLARYLAVTVGVPFTVLSATAPLLQSWLARSSHPDADDPYFLYAASNAGSLLALLGYPLLIEPLASLHSQRLGWAQVYGLLVLLVGGSALGLRRYSTTPIRTLPPDEESAAPPWRTRLHWLALAAVPSSLVLSVTTHISTNLAAVPLLWVVPLSIYLATFIVAFARRPLIRTETAVRFLPVVAIVPVVETICRAIRLEVVFMPLHFLFLGCAGLVCHGVLAAKRPAPARLTEFYLWMSLGGALGGLVTALVAPLVFVDVTEYPIGIVAACLLRPSMAWASARPWRGELVVPGVVLGLLIVSAGIVHVVDAAPRSFLWLVILFGPAFLVAMLVWHRRLAFGLSLAAMTLVSSFYGQSAGRELHAERNFFGQVRVMLDRQGEYRVLLHGNTLHGMQPTDPKRELEPVSYYHPQSGIARVFGAVGDRLADRAVAVVGLGAGSLSLYAHAGQPWTYYELNPAVTRIAQNPSYFTVLQRGRAHVGIVPGDARLSLTRAPDGGFGVIILDAFSSDAIPVHLLTREAVRLYFQKLTPDGVVVFHISNRYLRLMPVLGSIARGEGYPVVGYSHSQLTEQEINEGKTGGTWVVMARHVDDLGALSTLPDWRPVPAGPESTLWTDDYSNIVAVLDMPWSHAAM